MSVFESIFVAMFFLVYVSSTVVTIRDIIRREDMGMIRKIIWGFLSIELPLFGVIIG